MKRLGTSEKAQILCHSVDIKVGKAHFNALTNLLQKADAVIEEKLQIHMTFCNATSFESDAKEQDE